MNYNDISPPPSTKNGFIPPTSNELNFTHLKRVFDNKENIQDYFSENFRRSPLNILKTEVEKGNIEFHHVTDLQYYIFDIEGWVVQVDEFIRDNINSGWLISNIDAWQGEPLDYFKPE